MPYLTWGDMPRPEVPVWVSATTVTGGDHKRHVAVFYDGLYKAGVGICGNKLGDVGRPDNDSPRCAACLTCLREITREWGREG